MDEHFPRKAFHAWARRVRWNVLLLVAVNALIFNYYLCYLKSSGLRNSILGLTQEVARLKEQQEVPSALLDRYRSSICYIVGIYTVGFPNQPPRKRTRISGTGFMVADHLVATNRHIAQPWYEDPDSEALLAAGAEPRLEKLLAYFPGALFPINLIPAAISQTEDLALLRLRVQPKVDVQALPLASNKPATGELVAVVGYPMGVLAMVAKAPTPVHARLVRYSSRHDDQKTAGELATLSLIRPSATFGRLGDVVGDKLIYDAPTTHGASGGPVLNSRGEVVGINFAFIDGFAGANLGISCEALKPLILEAQNLQFGAVPKVGAGSGNN
jgi:Trypsin-like peptidase domain